MNIKNLEFLKDSLKYMGFGEKFNADLEAKISEQPAQFQLGIEGEFARGDLRDKVEYRLDFKKSKETDMYFFNKYAATLKNGNPEMERSQTFYINKGSGVTAKEAYNLLNGRAVNKDLMNAEGQQYNAWLQLDFGEKDKNDNFKVKQYHQGYGYDLEGSVRQYPIRELDNEEDRNRLLKSLQKGNIHQVTFLQEGKDMKKFVEANPQFKTLNLYDSNMNKQFQGIEPREVKEADRKQEKKEAMAKDSDDDSERKQKSTRQKKVSV